MRIPSLILYFKKPDFLKKAISLGIAFFFLLFLGKGAFQSLSTYYTWKKDPIGKYLVPPQNSNYFYRYCFFRYFLNLFLSVGLAFLLGSIFFILQKKNFVDINETLLVILGTIVTRFPNFIIFLSLSFLIAIFFGLWQNYKKGINKKVSLGLPLAISLLITISVGNFIGEYIGLTELKL